MVTGLSGREGVFGQPISKGGDITEGAQCATSQVAGISRQGRVLSCIKCMARRIMQSLESLEGFSGVKSRPKRACQWVP
jgi:hypothetical protein